MIEVLAYYKETECKYRWDTLIENTKFEFYIPKWRIPDTVPNSILVNISFKKDSFEDFTTISQTDVIKNPKFKEKPIYSIVKFNREHTETYRYDPVGDQDDWEIGSPYIPKILLDYNPTTPLYIKIIWR